MIRFLVVALAIFGSVLGHGVITKPQSRNEYLKLVYPGDPNDPVNYNEGNPVPLNDNLFICRGHLASKKQYWLNVTAGQTMQVLWENAHPGDVFLYMTLDGDLAYSEMKWFKIFDYAQETNPDPTKPLYFTIPSSLPSSSHAILRWEMYALHLKSQGTVEYYAACTDLVLQGSSARATIPTPTVKIPGNLPAGASYYRDAGTVGTDKFFFTGPPISSVGGQNWTPGVSNWTYEDSTPTTPNSPPTTPNSPPTTPNSPPTTPNSPPTTPNSPGTCTVGSAGCPCTAGGGCDPGLSCGTAGDKKICVSLESSAFVTAAGIANSAVFNAAPIILSVFLLALL